MNLLGTAIEELRRLNVSKNDPVLFRYVEYLSSIKEMKVSITSHMDLVSALEHRLQAVGDFNFASYVEEGYIKIISYRDNPEKEVKSYKIPAKLKHSNLLIEVFRVVCLIKYLRVYYWYNDGGNRGS